MPLLIALAVIVLLLIVGGAVLNVAVHLIWFLLVGLVVGALARLVLPGNQNLGWLATALYGAAGALLGGIVADAAELGTLLSIIASVAVAAALIALLGGWGRRDTDRMA